MPDPADLQAAIDELTATSVQSNAAADALVDAYAGVPARIQAAVDAATKAGATPAQLSALGSLKTTLDAEASKMRAALNAPATA